MAKTRLIRRAALAATVLAVVGVITVVAMNGASATTGPVTGIAGKCVDVVAVGTAKGTKIQLYTCNGTNAQRWTSGDDGTLRALGKCLDVAGAGTANGTQVQLWD